MAWPDLYSGCPTFAFFVGLALHLAVAYQTLGCMRISKRKMGWRLNIRKRIC